MFVFVGMNRFTLYERAIVMKITHLMISLSLVAFSFANVACDFSLRTGPGARSPSQTIQPAAPPAPPPPAPAPTPAAAAPVTPAAPAMQSIKIKRPRLNAPNFKDVTSTSSAPSTTPTPAPTASSTTPTTDPTTPQ